MEVVLFCGAGKLGALSYETRTLLNLYKVITGLTLWGWPNVGRPETITFPKAYLK
jgi:hypothetical protein